MTAQFYALLSIYRALPQRHINFPSLVILISVSQTCLCCVLINPNLSLFLLAMETFSTASSLLGGWDLHFLSQLTGPVTCPLYDFSTFTTHALPAHVDWPSYQTPQQSFKWDQWLFACMSLPVMLPLIGILFYCLYLISYSFINNFEIPSLMSYGQITTRLVQIPTILNHYNFFILWNFIYFLPLNEC